jgi:dTDP-4-amino-4,6-dideoxygalactose transaminase
VLCLHGISADAWNRYSEKGNWYYEVTECGYKYNLSDLQAALGIHQLRKQEGFIRIRREQAEFYNAAFSGVEELELPADTPKHRHCWHLYILRLRLEGLDIDRRAFIEKLRLAGVGSSVHFIPIPMHPAYSSFPTLSQELCPNAMSIYPRAVSLPLYPGLTEVEMHRVAGAVKDIVNQSRKRTAPYARTAVT